jgi:hypothetical protein
VRLIARTWSIMRADDGIRTRDPHLGKVMRYQLRYVRMFHSGQETQVVRDGTVSDEVGPRERGDLFVRFEA